MGKVVVLGVFVADTAYRASRMPKMGETILGNSFVLGPGGKGSNQAVAAGGEADPAAAEAAPKAALASRTNTLFSIPMLWFMVASAHMPSGSIMANTQAIVICCVIIALLEANAIWGKQYTMTTVKGVIASGLVLTVVLAGILRMF